MSDHIEVEARFVLNEAIHAYMNAIGAPGAVDGWVLVSQLSVIVEDDHDPIRHGYNYATAPGVSPATAIGLLTVGSDFARNNTGLSADDDG